ncbi:MAG: S-layer homology domain-containing protein [Paenibacillaceae bacterium]
MVNRSFGFTETTEISFTDVASTSWAYVEIAKAIKAGYITGYADGTMGANKQISRQEAAVIVNRLLNLTATDNKELAAIKDAEQIATWSKNAISAVLASKIMNGYADDSTFKPEKSITRAEAIVTLDRAISTQVKGVAYNTAGTYGPTTGIETVDQDVVINATGVTLQNMVINGKLLFAAGIGNGDAFLKNVTVKGDTIVQGGGENSIHFINSILLKIKVDKKGSLVRIVAEGTTTVTQVDVQSPVTIQETDLTGAGFTKINLTALLPDESKVTLKGDFESLDVVASKISIDINEGSVQKVTAELTATGMNLTLAKNVKVISLILDAVAQILGAGTIDTATLNAIAKAGVTYETQPTKTIDAIVPTTTVSTTPVNSGQGSTQQYGSVTGFVYDRSTHVAQANVTVSVYTSSQHTGTLVGTAFTDATGAYTIPNVPIGAYYFQLEKVGYIGQSYNTVQTVTANTTTVTHLMHQAQKNQ